MRRGRGINLKLKKNSKFLNLKKKVLFKLLSQYEKQKKISTF